VKQKYATENVANMLVNKLKRFQPSAQNFLKIASCLGSSFSTKLLATVVRTCCDEKEERITLQRRPSSTLTLMPDGESDIDRVISDFEVNGVWEQETDDVYRFSHDQVQLAAFELIPTEERSCLQGDIGEILFRRMDEKMIDESLFVIVGLKNNTRSQLDEKGRQDLIALNIKAGSKASDNAAFDSAVIYYQAAREMLGPKGWEIDQERTLKLFSAEAQARFTNGDLHVMNELIEEVLSRDIPVEDKFSIYETKILAATSGDRHAEALSTTLHVCKQLGFKPLPSKASKVKIGIEYLKTNVLVKGLCKEDIAALPDLSDKKVIMGQQLMEGLIHITAVANPNLFPLVSFRMLKESIKSGINRNSPSAFGTFGMILCIMGDVVRGRQMGEIAEMLLKRPGMRKVKSAVTLFVEAFIYHWTAPLQRSLTPLLKGYQAGLDTGDIRNAAMNLSNRGWNLWYSSRPLDDVLHQLEVSVKVYKAMKADESRMSILPLLQAVINLEGDAPKPWELSGKEMQFNQLYDLAVSTENHMVRVCAVATQLELFVIFQEWSAAKRLLLKEVDLRPKVLGAFMAIRYTFMEGLILFKAAQSSSSWIERKKLKARAKKSLKMMTGWLKKGNPNVVHCVHLLEAEHAVLEGNTIEAEESYKAASTAATRSGFLHDKALSHELAGNYYMEKGIEFWAKYNIKLAHTTMLEWKAKAKATELAKKYPQFISGRRKSSRTTGLSQIIIEEIDGGE